MNQFAISCVQFRNTGVKALNEMGMGFFAWIFVGLVAGWIAEQISGREHGLLMNLMVGIIGAIVGGLVFGSLLGFRYDQGFNLATIAIATGGAVLFLWMFGARPTRPLT